MNSMQVRGTPRTDLICRNCWDTIMGGKRWPDPVSGPCGHLQKLLFEKRRASIPKGLSRMLLPVAAASTLDPFKHRPLCKTAH